MKLITCLKCLKQNPPRLMASVDALNPRYGKCALCKLDEMLAELERKPSAEGAL